MISHESFVVALVLVFLLPLFVGVKSNKGENDLDSSVNIVYPEDCRFVHKTTWDYTTGY